MLTYSPGPRMRIHQKREVAGDLSGENESSLDYRAQHEITQLC